MRRVDAQGFTTPKASVVLQETLEAEGAPIQTYANERLAKDAAQSVLVSEIYKDYCDWCLEQNIEEPFKLGHFGTALKAAIPTIVHKRETGGERKYRYYGVRKRTVEEMKSSMSA